MKILLMAEWIWFLKSSFVVTSQCCVLYCLITMAGWRYECPNTVSNTLVNKFSFSFAYLIAYSLHSKIIKFHFANCMGMVEGEESDATECFTKF